MQGTEAVKSRIRIVCPYYMISVLIKQMHLGDNQLFIVLLLTYHKSLPENYQEN